MLLYYNLDSMAGLFHNTEPECNLYFILSFIELFS